MTKEMMVAQGYVPPTCTMPDPMAGLLIWQEINAGRNPCWGCNADRSACKGAPRYEPDTVEVEPRREARPPSREVKGYDVPPDRSAAIPKGRSA